MKTLGLVVAVTLLLLAAEGARAASCTVALKGKSPWSSKPEKRFMELRRDADSLKVFCTSQDHEVSNMDLLVAAQVEEPEETYCCNSFGPFKGFESREQDGHQEWWLKKDKFIVHIISARTDPKWSLGAEAEAVIKDLVIK